LSTFTSSAAERRRPAPAPLQLELTPPSPYRLPRFGGVDRVMTIRDGVATRLLRVGDSPVLVRAWHPDRRRVSVRAEGVDPGAVTVPDPAGVELRPAGAEELEIAGRRMRFALALDDDLGDFFRRFRRDPLLGPLLRRWPHRRPLRRPWAWEALAWAVCEQLIESGRAGLIERRIVGRWGARFGALRDVPPATLIGGRAPAEIEQLGLSPKRSIALGAAARQIAAGRARPEDPAGDRHLLAIPEIGAWTVQCLGLYGRGEADSLPAGDLKYIKQVGRLAHLGRRATVEEVEEFYAPYAPFRGWAAAWTMLM
jgi:3-methyladenine DNA glycosylase/8-oxoguanine DNA glycosylase